MLTKALQYYPNSYEIRYALADDMYKLKRYRDVLTVLDVITPNTIDAYVLEALSYFSLNKVDSAMNTLGKMVKLDPNSEIPYRYYVNIYKQPVQSDAR